MKSNFFKSLKKTCASKKFWTIAAVFALALDKTHLGADATEADVAPLLVLVLPHAQVGTYVVNHVLP